MASSEGEHLLRIIFSPTDCGLIQLNARNFSGRVLSFTQLLPPMRNTNSSKKWVTQWGKSEGYKEVGATTLLERKGT